MASAAGWLAPPPELWIDLVLPWGCALGLGLRPRVRLAGGGGGGHRVIPRSRAPCGWPQNTTGSTLGCAGAQQRRPPAVPRRAGGEAGAAPACDAPCPRRPQVPPRPGGDVGHRLCRLPGRAFLLRHRQACVRRARGGGAGAGRAARAAARQQGRKQGRPSEERPRDRCRWQALLLLGAARHTLPHCTACNGCKDRGPADRGSQTAGAGGHTGSWA